LAEGAKRLELTEKGRKWLDRIQLGKAGAAISGELLRDWLTLLDWGNLESGRGGMGELRGDVYSTAQCYVGQALIRMADLGERPFTGADLIPVRAGEVEDDAALRNELIGITLEVHFIRHLTWMGLVSPAETAGRKGLFGKKKDPEDGFVLTEAGRYLVAEIGRRYASQIPASLERLVE
jgi:hypothetical protein